MSTNPFNTISIIGLGYIGLPTAAVIASHDINVIGVDINQHVVDIVNSGKPHIVEPELEALVNEVVTTRKLRATTQVEPADAFLIAVPTPFKGDHVPDLGYVQAAAREIAPVLKKGDLVILESTSPVGSTEQIAQWLAAARPDLTFPQDAIQSADVNVAYCPERVLPGKVVSELIENDRIIGGLTKKCAERAAALYKIFIKAECIITNARTAEMCKLTENSFRDVNIAFANELSLICDELEIDVWELIRAANRHPRVNILQPGPGVGGHCIAVDPWFIVNKTPKTARLIRVAREVNDYKPHHIIEKIIKASAGLKNPKIACLGLTFKANIDDLRESPALEIVEHLHKKNIGQVIIVEPYIQSLPNNINSANVQLMKLEDAIAEANIIVLLVDHNEFKKVTHEDLMSKIVIDTRGMWNT
jgi:UDP-N-acetyl-D-mannosaminuronic acid dehydrogenase